MEIRDACILDLPEVERLAKLFFLESKFNNELVDYDSAKVHNCLLVMLQCPNLFYFRVVESQKGGLLGGMIGMCSPTWFAATAKECTDIGIFCDPLLRHSAGLAALRLLKDYVAWGFAHGAWRVCAGTTANPNVDLTKLYTRAGFSACGHVYEIERK
jgi:hypothetical protein